MLILCIEGFCTGFLQLNVPSCRYLKLAEIAKENEAKIMKDVSPLTLSHDVKGFHLLENCRKLLDI